jgi:hypothetical protein
VTLPFVILSEAKDLLFLDKQILRRFATSG